MGHGHAHAPATASAGQRRRLAVVLTTAGSPGRRGRRCRVSGSLALLADADTWPPTRSASPWPSEPSPWPSARPRPAHLRLAAPRDPGRGRERAPADRGGAASWSSRRSAGSAASGGRPDPCSSSRDRPGREPGVPRRAAPGPDVAQRGPPEVLADALGWAVIVAALVIAATAGRPPTRSPPCSSAAWSCPGPGTSCATLDALAPRRAVDLGRRAVHILGVDGVVGVHDLHAWTITSGLPVLSAHVVVTDEALDAGHGGRVLDAPASAWASTSTWRTAPSRSRPVRMPGTSPRSTTGVTVRGWHEERDWRRGGPRAPLGMWVPGAPPTWGRMFRRTSPCRSSPCQHRGTARLPGRGGAAAQVRGVVALVADAGLGRRQRRCSPSPAPG